MDEIKNVAIVEPDIYDCVVDGIASFAGIAVGVVIRCGTMAIIPEHDTIIKKVLRETGSIALSTAAMGMTQQSIKAIGAYLKPRIVKK